MIFYKHCSVETRASLHLEKDSFLQISVHPSFMRKTNLDYSNNIIFLVQGILL